MALGLYHSFVRYSKNFLKRGCSHLLDLGSVRRVSMGGVRLAGFQSYVCLELHFCDAPVFTYTRTCVSLCSDLPPCAVRDGIWRCGSRRVGFVCSDKQRKQGEAKSE